MRTIANTLVLVGTIVFGFVFLAAGGYFLGKMASTVVLSQADQASRDMSSILVLSRGIPGTAIIEYTIPGSGTKTNAEYLSFTISPYDIRVIDNKKSRGDQGLPDIEFPPDYDYTRGVTPREVSEVKKKLRVTVSEGRITDIAKVE